MTDRIPLQTVSDTPRLLSTGRDLFDRPKDAMPNGLRVGRSRYAYVTWSANEDRWIVRVRGVYVGRYRTVDEAVSARAAYVAGQEGVADAA